MADYDVPRTILRFCILCLLFTAFAYPAQSQDSTRITLDEVQQLAKQNYPAVKQRDLLRKTKEFTVANAAKGFLPQLLINGQATYQSEVTSFPFKIPNLSIPEFSRDQYKVSGEITQVVYDGGQIKIQQQSANLDETVNMQSLETELYTLRDRVNQIYFGCLLIEGQIKLNEFLRSDIRNGLEKTRSRLNNGTAFRSNADELQAQLLQAEQAATELMANRKAYREMLSLFMNKPLPVNTSLNIPAALAENDQVNRPELELYAVQAKRLDIQDQLIKAKLRPRLNVFLQGGYGRPGLNFLNNNFAFYYLGGLRLNWNLGSLYTRENEKKLVTLGRQNIDIQKETFLFNTHLSMKQDVSLVEKFRGLIKADAEIIRLRESVKHAASAQLENGVITAHDFITQVNALDQARQNLAVHEIQLLQAQYHYQYLTGN